MVSPKDFTLLIKLKGDFSQVSDAAQLEAAVDAQINPLPENVRRKIPIEKCVPVFNCADYIKADQQRLVHFKHLRISAAKGLPTDKAEAEHEKIKQRYRELHKLFSTDKFSRFTGYVFVTFPTQEDFVDAQERERLNRPKLFCMVGYGGAQAPEPEDIIWHNWGVSFMSRVWRRVLGFVTTYLIILLDFAILLAIKYFQRELKKRKMLSDFSLSLVNVVFSAVNAGISFLLSKTIRLLVDFEKYQTLTERSSELVRRTTFSYFINSVLLVLVVNAVCTDEAGWNLLGVSGTLGNIATSAIMRVVTLTVLTVLDFAFLLKVFNRKRLAVKLEKGSGVILQCEANEAFENMNVSLDSLYASILSSLFFAFFYQLLFPLGLLAAAATLALYFFAIKYVMCSRINRPVEMEFRFTFGMIRRFEFGIFLMCLGFILIRLHTGTGSFFHRPLLIAILLLGLFEWFFGSSVFSKVLQAAQGPETNEAYANHRLGFWTDYDRLNPIGSREAIRKFLIDAKLMGSMKFDQDQPSGKLLPPVKPPSSQRDLQVAKELTEMMGAFSQLEAVSSYNAYLTSRGLQRGERTYATDIDVDIMEEFSAAEAKEIVGKSANLYAAQLNQIDDQKYALDKETIEGYQQLIEDGGLELLPDQPQDFRFEKVQKTVATPLEKDIEASTREVEVGGPPTSQLMRLMGWDDALVEQFMRTKAEQKVGLAEAGRVPVPLGPMA